VADNKWAESAANFVFKKFSSELNIFYEPIVEKDNNYKIVRTFQFIQWFSPCQVREMFLVNVMDFSIPSQYKIFYSKIKEFQS
jgi:ABC-type branched-subunit amino acid transport system ATPase component